MKKITRKDIDQIVTGSSVLGGGGGGNLTAAKELAKHIVNPVTLISYDEIKEADLIITAFGVGGLKSAGDAKNVTLKNIEKLEKIMNKKITGVISVEIGPMSVANVLLTASLLKLPVVDADLVGYRAAPEIYLEAISLSDMNRLPLIASNSDGDTIILSEVSSLKSLEKILRNFSTVSKSKVYIAGYPFTKTQLKNSIEFGSISYTQKIGEILSLPIEKIPTNLIEEEFIFLDSGIIIEQKELTDQGFTRGELIIRSNRSIYTLFYKNEFLVLLRNGKTFLTCPDSIFLIDTSTKEGLNNGNNNIKKNVLLFAKKAIPLWRTTKGKKLFSPKNLGYDFKQVLLQ